MPRWYVFWSRLVPIWSRLESRPAFVFILLSFVFGSAISVVVPPLRGPDEIAHFLRIYSYARGGLLPVTEVNGRKGLFIDRDLYTQLSFFKNAGERFFRNREQGLRYGEIMKEYPPQGGMLDAERQATKFMPFAGTEGYNPVAYAPYVLAAAIGNLLELDFPNMLLLMRFLGLITFTAVATLLRHCPANGCHLPRLDDQCRFTSWCTRDHGDYWIIDFGNYEFHSTAGGTLVSAVNFSARDPQNAVCEVLGVCCPIFVTRSVTHHRRFRAQQGSSSVS